MEFASALQAVVVFTGQPKQGWKLSFVSLAEKLMPSIVSFCQTCPRSGWNCSWGQSGNERGMRGVGVGQRGALGTVGELGGQGTVEGHGLAELLHTLAVDNVRLFLQSVGVIPAASRRLAEAEGLWHSWMQAAACPSHILQPAPLWGAFWGGSRTFPALLSMSIKEHGACGTQPAEHPCLCREPWTSRGRLVGPGWPRDGVSWLAKHSTVFGEQR